MCSLPLSEQIWTPRHTFLAKEKSREGCGSPLAGFNPLVCFCVVFVFVDAIAHVIRFAVELALILLRQMTIILGHIFLLIILKALFAAFEPPRFSRRELAALYSVGDSVLLVLFALIDLIHAWMPGINIARSGTSGVALLRGSGSDKHQATRRKD